MFRKEVGIQLLSTLQPIDLIRLLLVAWLISTFIVSLVHAINIREGRRLSVLRVIVSVWLLLNII